ncbi:MAG TPA: hypothetical protein VKZ53_06340 [Candidatus Angelobacter sp.]|nr:hypothetical protein [Candidatus Angelobacter sp.]
MIRNEHDEARELIALGGDLSENEHGRLLAHLRGCKSCSDYAEAAGRVARALHSLPLAADSSLVRATQLRVRARAMELQQQRERMRLVFIACLFVGTSAAITTPLLWRIFTWIGAWIGSWTGTTSLVWQVSFAFFWIAPALTVSAILLARGAHWAENKENRWR